MQTCIVRRTREGCLAERSVCAIYGFCNLLIVELLFFRQDVARLRLHIYLFLDLLRDLFDLLFALAGVLWHIRLHAIYGQPMHAKAYLCVSSDVYSEYILVGGLVAICNWQKSPLYRFLYPPDNTSPCTQLISRIAWDLCYYIHIGPECVSIWGIKDVATNFHVA